MGARPEREVLLGQVVLVEVAESLPLHGLLGDRGKLCSRAEEMEDVSSSPQPVGMEPRILMMLLMKAKRTPRPRRHLMLHWMSVWEYFVPSSELAH